MNPLLSILHAAHCRSTHHFFAVDALRLVQTESGIRLARHLVRHHDRYLTGAKDPDTRFRDFQNHVVHVTDGYWGGAPRVAHKWYDRLQNHLRNDRFREAAHAAGVLSHYFTDPMQPLHTQQCDREKVLHRPIEWSITKSYPAIFRCWKEDAMRVVFQLSDGPGWLGEAILHGARFANRKYWPLLDGYDLDRGANDPPAGLNADMRASLAELFGLAVTGWARVIERAAADAEAGRGQPLPSASLSLAAVLATIRVPARLWVRRIEDRNEQRAVTKLIDEFQQTGTLRDHVPAEVDVVHRVVRIREQELRWQQSRKQRLASTRTVVHAEPIPAEPIHTEPVVASPAIAASPTSDEMPATIPFVPRAASAAQRGTLMPADELVDAPSIGPKTAARFTAIGIGTVGEFLSASAESLAKRLDTYWITANTVSQWQAQARLMCEVPGLKCRDAQLLAGANCETAAKLAAYDSASLHREVSEFAATTSGRRYLRGAAPPTVLDVKKWIGNAGGQSQSPLRRSA